MKKAHLLMGSAGCIVVAAVLGALALYGAAFSIGLASMGLFAVSTQVKE